MDNRVTSFTWQWGDFDPQCDPMMTRQRASKLLRRWRRGMRLPPRLEQFNGGPIYRLQRTGAHTYRVEHCATGEIGTIQILPVFVVQ